MGNKFPLSGHMGLNPVKAWIFFQASSLELLKLQAFLQVLQNNVVKKCEQTKTTRHLDERTNETALRKRKNCFFQRPCFTSKIQISVQTNKASF